MIGRLREKSEWSTEPYYNATLLVFIQNWCPTPALSNGENRSSLSCSYQKLFEKWQPAFYFESRNSFSELFRSETLREIINLLVATIDGRNSSGLLVVKLIQSVCHNSVGQTCTDCRLRWRMPSFRIYSQSCWPWSETDCRDGAVRESTHQCRQDAFQESRWWFLSQNNEPLWQ